YRPIRPGVRKARMPVRFRHPGSFHRLPRRRGRFVTPEPRRRQTPRTHPMTTTRLVKAILTAAAVVALPTVAGAVEVKVENYTDDPIAVALAYNKWKGDLAVEGWFTIKSGENRTFQADDATDMHMRIPRKGNEVT